MKQLITFLLILVSLNSFSYPGGSGTIADPYLISSETDLRYLGNTSTDWDKHFKQTADITLSYTDDDNNNGHNMIAIGSSATPFTGSYDGNGHTITGIIMVNGGTDDYQGLFGNVNTSYSIKNLGLIDPIIWGNNYIGGLVGNNGAGTIENCYVTGGSLAGFAFGNGRGGITGRNAGTVKNCYASITIRNGKYAGGLVGYNIGIIEESYYYNMTPATGYSYVIDGYGNYTGGFVGGNIGGSITKCFTITSDIKLSGLASTDPIFNTPTNYVYLGGFVGYNTGSITQCYAANGLFTVTNGASSYGGLTTKGGFSGYNSSSSITQCYWDTTTSGETSMTGVDSSETSGAIGKTTSEMQTQSTYTSWDFSNDWIIDNTIYPNIDYPVLRPSSLGIEEVSTNDKLLIYPNPTSNFLEIKVNRIIDKISIYNSPGKQIKTLHPNYNKIDVSTLTSGMYFIQFTFEDKTVNTLKFIKK